MSDNLSLDYQKQATAGEGDRLVAEYNALKASNDSFEKQQDAAKRPTVGAVVKDVAQGGISGVNRGISQMIRTAHEVLTFTSPKDSAGKAKAPLWSWLENTADFIDKKQDGFDKANPSTTQLALPGGGGIDTQDIARPVAQFGVGMIPAAKASSAVLKGAKGLKTAGKIAKASLDAGVGANLSVDPKEDNMLLKIEEGDSEAVMRMKKFTENAVLGAAGDAVLLAAIKPFKAFFKARALAKAEGANPKAMSAVEEQLAKLQADIDKAKNAETLQIEHIPGETPLSETRPVAGTPDPILELGTDGSPKQIGYTPNFEMVAEPRIPSKTGSVDLGTPLDVTPGQPLDSDEIFHRLRTAASEHEAPTGIVEPNETSGQSWAAPDVNTPVDMPPVPNDEVLFARKVRDIPSGSLGLGENLDFEVPGVTPPATFSPEGLIQKPEGFFGEIHRILKGEGGALFMADNPSGAGWTSERLGKETHWKPEATVSTQIPNTEVTYKKVLNVLGLNPENLKGKVLDFSGGLGNGTKFFKSQGMDAYMYEPFYQTKKGVNAPDYVKLDGSDIPQNTHSLVVNNAVLNVVPLDVRNSIVRNIGLSLADNGQAFISARSPGFIKELDKSGLKHTLLGENEVLLANGAYQKGFTQVELEAYIKSTLGDGFTVQAAKGAGDSAVLVTKTPGASVNPLSNTRGAIHGGVLPTLLGGSSGAFVDYDGSGRGSITNIAIGAAIGIGGQAVLRKILHAAPAEAQAGLKAMTEDMAVKLDAMETQIKEELLKPTLTSESRATLKKNLETIGSMRAEYKTPKFESPAAFQASIKKASTFAEFKPVVSINKESTEKFMKAVSEGDWHEVNNHILYDIDNVRQLHPDDAEAAIQNVTTMMKENFTEEHLKATRGVVGWDTTKKMADGIANDFGMATGNVNQMFKKTKGLDARFLAAKSLMNSTNVKLNNMLADLLDPASLVNGELDAAKVLAVDRLVTFAGAIQAQVKGSQAEIARALNAMKMQGKVKDTLGNIDLAKVQDLISETGGMEAKKKALDNLRIIIGKGDTAKINRYTRGLQGNPTLKFLNELHRTVMLSAPVTHVANTSGNLLTTFLSVPESLFQDAMTGDMTLGSSRAMLEALVAKDVWHEALQYTKQTWKSGESVLSPVSKLDGQPLSHGISYDNFKSSWIGQGIDYLAKGVGLDAPMAQGIDATGEALRGTFKLLGASDEFFKTLNFRAGLHKYGYEEAMRKGLMEGKQGKQLAEYVANMKAELTDSPTEELFEKAMHHAEVMTFQNKAEGFLGDVSRAINKPNELAQTAQQFIPFTKTPANIANYVFDRTGLNIIQQEVRDTLKNGTKGQKAEIYSRWAAGSMLILSGVGMGSAGWITGGGGDKDASNMQLGGHQRYGANIGGYSLGFSRFEPLATLFSFGAEVSDIMKIATDPNDKRKAMEATQLAFMNMLTSKTMLRGLATLTTLSTESGGKQSSVWKSHMMSYLPAGINAVAQQFDPLIRDTISVLDGIKARIPGLSSTLPPLHDVFNRPMTREKLGIDMVSPIPMSKISNDPVDVLFERLNIETTKNKNSMKQMSLVDLTAEQHAEWWNMRGEMLKEKLDALVDTQGFLDRNELPESPQSKQAVISTIMNETQAKAGMRLLNNHPELKELVLGNKERLKLGEKRMQQEEVIVP